MFDGGFVEAEVSWSEGDVVVDGGHEELVVRILEEDADAVSDFCGILG